MCWFAGIRISNGIINKPVLSNIEYSHVGITAGKEELQVGVVGRDVSVNATHAKSS